MGHPSADGGYKQDRDVVVDEDGDDGVVRMGGRVRKEGGGSLTLVPVIKGPLPPCVRILQPKYRQKEMLPQNESNTIRKLKDTNQSALKISIDTTVLNIFNKMGALCSLFLERLTSLELER